MRVDRLAIKNDSHYSDVMFTVPPPKPVPAPTADVRGHHTQVPCIDSQALLGPRGEVHIVHQGQLYRLRITSLGKLLLTK